MQEPKEGFFPSGSHSLGWQFPFLSSTNSLLDQLEEVELLLVKTMEEVKPSLEREHGVRISEDAIFCAAQLTRHYFSPDLPECQSGEKAVDILKNACLALREQISSGADEKRLDKLAYLVSRSLLETSELAKEIPMCRWPMNLEYEKASDELMEFITSWKPLLFDRKQAKKLGEQMMRLFHKCFRDIPACFSSSGNQKEDLSESSAKLQTLDALARTLEEALPSKFIDELMTLQAHHVAEVVSHFTGIPIPALPFSGSTDIEQLEEQLRGRVVGQDHAIDAVVRSLRTRRMLNIDHKRPWASLLFLGPSGVGKAETAKCIAEVIFGDVGRLIRVDLSDHKELKGVEPHTGSTNVTPELCFAWLGETVGEKPHSVILLEKIERAHPHVFDSLLPDIISGKLSDKDGCFVNLSNAIVIMTSNVGSERLKSNTALSHAVLEHCLEVSGREEVLHEQARKTFALQFLKSLDDIIVFDTLRSIPTIAQLILRHRAQEISEDRLLVFPSRYALEVLVKNQCAVDAKAIGKWVDEKIVPFLRGTLDDLDDKYSTIFIDTLLGTDELSFRLEKTDFFEDWLLKHHNLSFKKLRRFYVTQRALVDGVFQLRSSLFRLLNALGDCTGQIHVHYIREAVKIMLINNKILHSGWLNVSRNTRRLCDADNKFKEGQN